MVDLMDCKARKAYLIFTLLLAMNIFSAIPGRCAYRDEKIKERIGAGDKFIMDGKYQDALVEYQEALKLNPDDADSNYKVGVAYYFLNKFPESIEAYKKAISLNPRHVKALNNLALIYQKQDENVEASMLYQKALEINPDYYLARYNLGVVLYRRDRIDQAEATAREIIKLKPDYSGGYYLLGLILENNDKFGEAEIMYGKAVELDSRNTEAQDGLKRLKTAAEATAKWKEELEKARNIVFFRLPPDYRFIGLSRQDSGADIILVKYKGEQDIFLVKFPDSHAIGDRDINALVNKPGIEVEKVLNNLKITELIPVESVEFASEESEAGKSTTGKSVRYVKIKCKRDGVDSSGIMALHKMDAQDDVILFMAVSPGNSFALSVAKKFLMKVGTPQKEVKGEQSP
jgi:tetratricopeptide (TPR) repeat protein